MILLKKILKWTGVIIVVAFVALVIYRAFVLYGEQKTAEQVQKIHNTKLALTDVLGENLPVPSEVEGTPDYDTTIAGLDTNKNGIRDDVELAIFSEYPNSARTRAVLLQYALALQMEVTQGFLNEDIVNAIVEEDSRAGTCIADTLVPRKSPSSSRTYSDIEKIDAHTIFVDEKQFNNTARKTAKDKFYEYMGSYSNSPKPICDIDLSTLPN